MTVLAALGPLGIGVIVAAVVGGLFAFRKTRADAHKATAEGEKAEADAAEKLTQIALSLVEPTNRELAAVRRDLDAHKQSDADAREARKVAAVEHMAWDIQAAEQIRALGGDIDNPPPLYEGDHL
ncbi:hypothetical protein ACFWQG_12990 [Rhodococcus sp. NPDC058532]|uniref:hypothetical protein n=1 Tax=Rhodococcus sp. NPDC058532 TaxID=3346540 RepID=UPI003663AD7E